MYTLESEKIKLSHLKTFLMMKMILPDQFTYTHDLPGLISKHLGLDIKTVKSHINKLKSVNMIGLDTNRKKMYLRAKYRFIPRGNQTSICVKVTTQHFKHFTPFVLAAVVGHRAKLIAYRKSIRRMPDLINRGSLQGITRNLRSLKRFQPIAVTYLSAVTQMSVPWVDKYKQKAIALGFIIRKADTLDTNFLWSERKYLDTDLYGRMRYRKGKVSIVGIDLLASTLIFCKRKKSRR